MQTYQIAPNIRISLFFKYAKITLQNMAFKLRNVRIYLQLLNGHLNLGHSIQDAELLLRVVSCVKPLII